VERQFAGPDERTRVTQRVQLWGKAVGADGACHLGFLETPEPYQLTLATALGATRRVLAGDVPPGARTPSQAFGASFITEVGGSTIEFGRPSDHQGELSDI
jgi:short subunit dehydrogenase-like uncharacterized protein